jgi:hypothetical protein
VELAVNVKVPAERILSPVNVNCPDEVEPLTVAEKVPTGLRLKLIVYGPRRFSRVAPVLS